ncbi:MAG: NAD(P)-binding domain-containing protein [Deinococcota bacterium]
MNLCVIGGRGPHGLAAHLYLQDRGFTDYCLLDPASSWLPLYSPDGIASVKHLRSPRELDFSLGDSRRSMANFVAEDGKRPLANVYSLQDVQQKNPREDHQPRQHAERSTFWQYANSLAEQSKAADYLIPEAAEQLEHDGSHWHIKTSSGGRIRARAIILATGLLPHTQAPRSWWWWQHLPAERKALALQPSVKNTALDDVAGKRVVVVGSSNLSAWETATHAAHRGAHVTLLARAQQPTVQTLPFESHWFTDAFIREFSQLPQSKRLRQLNHYRPTSIMPVTLQDACDAGVDVHLGARVRSAVTDGRGVQLLYAWSGCQLDATTSTPELCVTQQKARAGEHSIYADVIVAATGSALRLKELPLVQDAARTHRGPVLTQGPHKHLPILAQTPLGTWKNLPSFFPMGAYARGLAGLGVNSLASATVYLPLVLEQLLARDSRLN